VGVKRPGHAADHSPPSSAEVKNAWSYTSTPLYAFMAWCSVKAQRQLYLNLYLQTQFSAKVLEVNFLSQVSVYNLGTIHPAGNLEGKSN
jgi:hypothetical protein